MRSRPVATKYFTRLVAANSRFCDLTPKVKAGAGIVAPGAVFGLGSGTLPPG